MQIHDKIRQARVSAGLTQAEMAEKLGIERSTYQYWEKKTPSIDSIKLVAKTLKLSEDYFFVRNDEKKQVQETPQENPDTRILIQTLQDHNKILREVIFTNLTGLGEVIKSNQEILGALLNSQTAHDEIIIGSLERLEKKPKGSLSVEADKREIDLRKTQNQRGKQGAPGTDGKH